MTESAPGSTDPTDVTGLLAAWRKGDDEALERALPRLYAELRHLAHKHLANESPGHTLDTRDLVHEAYLRIENQRRFAWQNRSHFLAVAGRMMRRILIDHARRKQVRGGRENHLELNEAALVAVARGMDLVKVDDALNELARTDEELAQIVELRFFGGLRHAEVAEVMETSEPTVRRRFRVAKAWLYRELRGKANDG